MSVVLKPQLQARLHIHASGEAVGEWQFNAILITPTLKLGEILIPNLRRVQAKLTQTMRDTLLQVPLHIPLVLVPVGLEQKTVQGKRGNPANVGHIVDELPLLVVINDEGSLQEGHLVNGSIGLKLSILPPGSIREIEKLLHELGNSHLVKDFGNCVTHRDKVVIAKGDDVDMLPHVHIITRSLDIATG